MSKSLLNLIKLYITWFHLRCPTQHRFSDSDSAYAGHTSIAGHFLWLTFPITIPVQMKKGANVLENVKKNLYMFGEFFLVKVFSGSNFTSFLNIKTLKNISLFMFMRVFQANLNHKVNTEYGPQELFCIFSTFLQYTKNMWSSASKFRANNHIFVSRFPTIRGGFKICSVIKNQLLQAVIMNSCLQSEVKKSFRRCFSKLTIEERINFVF